MITLNEVHRKIREISSRVANPRPIIGVAGLASELMIQRIQLLPLLVELKDLRLIQFQERAVESIKLTLLGYTVRR